jgi:DNA-binding PadR family transcriptional regulator
MQKKTLPTLMTAADLERLERTTFEITPAGRAALEDAKADEIVERIMAHTKGYPRQLVLEVATTVLDELLGSGGEFDLSALELERQH